MAKTQSSVGSKKFSPWRLKAVFFVLFDAISLMVSYAIALLVVNEMNLSAVSGEEWMLYLKSMPFWIVFTVAILYAFRCYHSVWRFAGVVELKNLIVAFFLVIPVYVFCKKILAVGFPLTYYVIGYGLSMVLCAGHRFFYRFLRYFLIKRSHAAAGACNSDRVMVIGAGVAGQLIIREIKESPRISDKVLCVIDDDPQKKGFRIEGVEIVGDRYKIMKAVDKYQITKIIFAIPTCTTAAKKDILNICKETGCRIQVVPGIYQLVNNELGIGQLRDVEITDLLGRDQILVNSAESESALADRVVLVTGGGGSIGSELCRQIARAKPRQLILVDIYENNAFEIQHELLRTWPELDLVVLIASVRNTLRMEEIMRRYRPSVVFHAAAHKHVPLMEDSPCEAIKNNVFGTYKTALAAEKYEVEKFVLISTDKAVNPTNIMGASKRICEMVVQMMDRRAKKTSFVAVRFGNVLGSNGSVIPLFKKQIAKGGPVTVTDKRIIRYFMTISEAVALVLQASYYAKGGEIFVLDMGEPVKIDDMARNLIRLSGYRPDVDIPIVYTGLRPGEKLYEELLMEEEGLQETENKLIHIGKPIEMNDEDFMEKLAALDKAARLEQDSIRDLVQEIVPTYQYKK